MSLPAKPKRNIGRWVPGVMKPLLDRISLADGAHDEDDKAACLMEAVSYITGQEFTDTPICVHADFSEVGQLLNDNAPSTVRRNRLKALVPYLIGTRPVTSGRYYGRSIMEPLPVYEYGPRQKADHRRRWDAANALLSTWADRDAERGAAHGPIGGKEWDLRVAEFRALLEVHGNPKARTV